MEKKVIDILPPRKPERKKVAAFKPKKEPGFKFSLPKIPFKKNLLLILLVILAVGIFAYFSLAQAEIEIWPVTEIKTFETKLTADIKVEKNDLFAALIPGTIFEEEETFSQEFPASGKKLLEKKAEGIIKVFNDSQREQILIAQTRFQPPLEKFRPPLERGENPWFRIQERIIIPAKSSIEVRVVADGPGEKYNIEPSTFSVPGLAGTPQYTFVYGKSSEPMKGGLKKEVPEVTEEDLKKAEELLKEKALKEIKDALRSKIPPEFVTLEEQILTEILETSSPVKVGTELEKFTLQVKAKAKTIAFKKENLENFSKEFIISQIPTDKKIDQKSLKIEYLPGTINLERGKIILSLNLEAKIYSDLDGISLKQGLAGKTLSESQFFLQNQPEIKKAKVKLWPFWLKKVPGNLEKIKIKIVVDSSPISE